MPRLSTRRKRRMGLTPTSQKHRFHKANLPSKRMKSFASEDAAKAWAAKEKLVESRHELRQLHSGKWQWRAKNPRLA